MCLIKEAVKKISNVDLDKENEVKEQLNITRKRARNI